MKLTGTTIYYEETSIPNNNNIIYTGTYIFKSLDLLIQEIASTPS